MKTNLVIALFIFSCSSKALDLPRPSELDWSDTQVIECIKRKSIGMRNEFNNLEKKIYEYTKDKKNIESIILAQRRLQEEFCKTEASCVSNSLKADREFIYGQTFSTCIRNVSNGELH